MTASTGVILLVEDDQDIRDSIKDVLEDEGYIVVEAADGVEALEQLRSASALPGLVLLDLMMPRMDGAQLRAEMLAHPGWASNPVVILSADAEAKTKAASLAVAACLEKPIKLALLFETVRRTLQADSAAP